MGANLRFGSTAYPASPASFGHFFVLRQYSPAYPWILVHALCCTGNGIAPLAINAIPGRFSPPAHGLCHQPAAILQCWRSVRLSIRQTWPGDFGGVWRRYRRSAPGLNWCEPFQAWRDVHKWRIDGLRPESAGSDAIPDGLLTIVTAFPPPGKSIVPARACAPRLWLRPTDSRRSTRARPESPRRR